LIVEWFAKNGNTVQYTLRVDDLALMFIVLLSIDAWHALWFIDPVTGEETLGLGVGTLVLTLNVILEPKFAFLNINVVIPAYANGVRGPPIQTWRKPENDIRQP